MQELWPTSREQYVNMWICEPVNPSALPLSCSWLKTVRDNTTLDSKVSCIFFTMYVDISELMIQCHGPYVFHHLFPPLTLFDPPPSEFWWKSLRFKGLQQGVEITEGMCEGEKGVLLFSSVLGIVSSLIDLMKMIILPPITDYTHLSLM